MSQNRYLLFHKPYGVLCQFTDSMSLGSLKSRPCLKDYIPIPDVYAAGRLDWDSEGLLLLTNDGNLIHSLAAPVSKLTKIYCVQVEGQPTDNAILSLRKGVVIEGKKTLPAGAERFPEGESLPPRSVPIRFRKQVPVAWLKLTLMEGRNRQVRRMTAAVGYPTLRLIRQAIGPFSLDGLDSGQWIEIPESIIRQKMSTFSTRNSQP